jgi:hypothetical protein
MLVGRVVASPFGTLVHLADRTCLWRRRPLKRGGHNSSGWTLAPLLQTHPSAVPVRQQFGHAPHEESSRPKQNNRSTRDPSITRHVGILYASNLRRASGHMLGFGAKLFGKIGSDIEGMRRNSVFISADDEAQSAIMTRKGIGSVSAYAWFSRRRCQYPITLALGPRLPGLKRTGVYHWGLS